MYEKASKSGHWKAPFDLARMHMNGQGTPQIVRELPVYFEFSTTSERDGQMN